MSLRRVVAFAPGSVGNVGPGLDILGLAVDGPGDAVTAEWTVAPGLRVLDPGHPDLPRDPGRHTSALAARAVLDRVGESSIRGRGIALSVVKGLPLSGGQGGSAASAVAGAVAVNALLGGPLDATALIEACLSAEEVVAGRHADNLAPSLLGGIVLIRSMEPIDIVRLPVPRELHVVLARPDQRLRTAEGRADALTAIRSAGRQLDRASELLASIARGDHPDALDPRRVHGPWRRISAARERLARARRRTPPSTS